jgi:hypothetical protein
VTPDVTVAWVHSDQVAHSWFLSMMGMLAETPRTARPVLPVRCGTDGLVFARNQGAATFLASDAEWLFWIDTDMGFAPDTLTRLLEVADPETAPVVGGLCFTNKYDSPDGLNGDRCFAVPTLFKWVQLTTGENGYMPILDYPRDAVVPVAATGSACILIHRTVFERIPEQGRWYNKLTNPTTGQVIGEDLSFCHRAAAQGIPLAVHSGVRTSHLKPIWLQEADYAHPLDQPAEE